MVSKIFFSVLAGLVVVQLVSADSNFCPQPENSKLLVFKQNVREAAPEFGRVEKEFFIPKLEDTVNCITITGDGSASASIASIGLLDDGSIKVKLVSAIKQPINVVLDAYSKEP